MDNAPWPACWRRPPICWRSTAADSFRIRSYRRAAEAAEQTTVDLAAAAADTARLLEIPGIGKSMAANLQAIAATGTLPLRDELLAKYGAGLLELLKLPGMGPKTVALLWDAAQDRQHRPACRGHRSGPPERACRAWAPSRLKSCARASRTTGAAPAASASTRPRRKPQRIAAYLLAFKGIERVTPAGSLRRGRETAGDLDLLVTGPACAPEHTAAAVEYVAAYPGIHDMIAKGENKVSFHRGAGLAGGRAPAAVGQSYGAALQYFTGSKAHNVALRQRALKMGYTLSEWALARLDDDSTVAAATEEEIYAALGMDWMPPEMRENLGEIEAAARHALPRLIEPADIRGDVHMHTTASDGRNSIREMAEAALACGLPVHRHHRPLQEPGHDQRPRRKARARAHRSASAKWTSEMEGRIRVFTGIEVDILADGALDLDDEVLAQMDVVIASVHTRFEQSREEMTARVLRAIENPYVRILGHPTGRLLLRREPFAHRYGRGAAARRRAGRGRGAQRRARAARPERPRPAPGQGTGLQDRDQLRLARRPQPGQDGLRRAAVAPRLAGPEDVLNTRDAEDFLAGAAADGRDTVGSTARSFRCKSRVHDFADQSQDFMA